MSTFTDLLEYYLELTRDGRMSWERVDENTLETPLAEGRRVRVEDHGDYYKWIFLEGGDVDREQNGDAKLSQDIWEAAEKYYDL